MLLFVFLAIVLLVLSLYIIILYGNKAPRELYGGGGTSFILKNIIKNGQFNRSVVSEAYFDDNAKNESSFLQNRIKLVNSGKNGSASFVATFAEPVDLDKKSILLVVRAARGAETAKLILKDAGGRIFELPELSFLPGWNRRLVYQAKRDDFDMDRVGEMRFEFGSDTTGNRKGAVFYLKNIALRGSSIK